MKWVLLALVLTARLGAQPQATASSTDLVSRLDVKYSDVFDTTESHKWYASFLNKLHVNTREDVIRRESLLVVGEPYDSAEAAESVRNLRKLGVFSTVSLDTLRDTGLVVTIRTQDAWTTKPFVTFKSSGSQSIWGFGITETNLLGRLINVLVSYRNEPDRTIKRVAVSAPRIIANDITLAGLYENFSDGRHDSIGVALPFLSLAAPISTFFTAEDFDGDVLRYFNGEHTASDTLRRRLGIVRASFARALQRSVGRGYLRAALNAQYRRDDFVPRALAGTIPRTTTAAIYGHAEWSRADFVVAQNYRNLGPDEDVDLSATTRVGVALTPESWGYDRTGWGPLFDLRYGRRIGQGFLTFVSTGSTIFESGGLDSGTVTVDVTQFIAPRQYHSLVLHADAGWSKNPVPGNEFDLGLRRGPRAFPDHAFTGDRSFMTMAEYRWVALPDIKKLASVALAGFVDYGGAWYNGSPKRTGSDVGMGFRFGSVRLPSVTGAFRMDLAYRFKNDTENAGFVLVFGSGFAYEKAVVR